MCYIYRVETSGLKRKVQRAEDMCHVMSKTLHLCWEHLNFRAVFEAAEELLRKAKKKCGDTEKNKEKLEAYCTGFSAEFFGSQSVEMFGFARKTKIQILTTSCWSLTRIHQLLLKSLRLHLLLIPYPLLFVYVLSYWMTPKLLYGAHFYNSILGRSLFSGCGMMTDRQTNRQGTVMISQ